MSEASYLSSKKERKMRRKIAAAAVLALALAAISCQKDDTLYYNNMTMGNIVDGQLISDQGNAFNVVEQSESCIEQLDTMTRAIVICDILNAVKGTANEYDIRLNAAASVLTKSPVEKENVSDEMDAEDPIQISQLWFSGGYMNMLLKYPTSKGKDGGHSVSLVWSKGTDGEYIFELFHNAYGDIWDGASSATNLDLNGKYMSFPVSGIIEGDSASVVIVYRWYRQAGHGWSSEIENYRIGYSWKRDEYEQVPSGLSL